MKILKESPLNQTIPSQIGKKFKCDACKTKFQLETEKDYVSSKVYGTENGMDYECPHFKFSTKCPECKDQIVWKKYV